MTSASSVRLTELTSCGGCAAKWGAAVLPDLLAAVPSPEGSPGATAWPVLVGLAPPDDAAVVQLTEGLALVSTTDFFPPLVDDPADYGAIAAANACSDVFAMGGDVVVALNLAAFPETLPVEVIRAVLAAAAEVVAEAGGIVAGGHTIRSDEPIFGLAVQGVVVPGEQFTTGGARAGDTLVLSKPLGTGLALAGGDEAVVAGAVRSMRALNREAAAVLRRHRSAVHAVTDVTGFGLLGHAWEVAERSVAHLVLDGAALPILDGVAALAAGGVRTGGHRRNEELVAGHVTVDPSAATTAVALDPQTSGGLLAAVDPTLVAGAGGEALAAAGFVPIGHVEAGAAAVTLT